MCECVPRVRACSRLMFRQSSPFQFNRLPAQRRWHFVMLCCRPSSAPPRAECYQSVRSNLAARSRADSFERCGRLWSWRTVDGGRRLTIFIINLPSYSTTMERAARKTLGAANHANSIRARRTRRPVDFGVRCLGGLRQLPFVWE